jgi:hypothetical protein
VIRSIEIRSHRPAEPLLRFRDVDGVHVSRL